METVCVAVTQQEPEWLDLSASVAKTVHLIGEAASNQAKLITFPECWIPGYPAWIWSRAVDLSMARKYITNSLAYDSEEMRLICGAAKKSQIAVSLGFSERDGDSLYISQCIIDATGEILVRRRKLKPTHMERTMFGDASGRSLLNVAQLPFGRVGALACWEHIQPLLKYHTMTQREQIHVSAWPPLQAHSGGEAIWGMSMEGCLAQSQIYALESGTFVLHTTAVISQEAIKMMQCSDPLFGTPGGGASAVIGPDGRLLSTLMEPNKEGIIYAELNLADILTCRHFMDACGHYSRPDMLWLAVDRQEKMHSRSDVTHNRL